MTRRRRRRRTAKKRGDHAGTVIVFLCAGGLASALLCLVLIGPPPAARIDALWVNDHRAETRIALFGVALAVTGTTLAFIVRRGRRTVTGVWLGASMAAGVFFSDAIRIIVRVLIEHSM